MSYLAASTLVTGVLVAALTAYFIFQKLGSIGDPYTKDHPRTKDEVRDRQNALAELSGTFSIVPHLKDNPLPNVSAMAGSANSFHISTVDMFVEIAQRTLIARKKIMNIYAFICGVIFVVMIVLFELIAQPITFAKDVIFNKDYLSENIPVITRLDWPEVFYLIARNGSAIAIYLFLLYLIVSLFRAFIHEATILENRIHSIRLGRLFYYTKFLGASTESDVAKVSALITADEIEKVFGWNIETSTAFKDINPELVSRGVFSQIASAIAGLSRKD